MAPISALEMLSAGKKKFATAHKRPVPLGRHRMMFRPRDSYDQKLLGSTLVIAPEPIHLRWLHDPFGNCVTVAEFGEPAQELRFESTIRLEHSPAKVPDFPIEDYARTYPFSYRSEEVPDLVPAYPLDRVRER